MKHETAIERTDRLATERGHSCPPDEESEQHATERGHSCPPVPVSDRGLESPRSGSRSFFNPHAEIDVTRNRLPHWQQGEAWVFITWRLDDSLPKAKLDQWKEERAIWLSHHPEPWTEQTETDYHERFSRQIDEWLDQGSGSCVLKDAANAGIVADALRHFDGQRCELVAFVVMPNHVHVLFRPLCGHALPAIMKSLKGFTAREINKRIGKAGTLWQAEYLDRLIRSERHFLKVVEYIRKNPVKAKLREGTFVVWERGACRSGDFPVPVNETELIETERGLSCPPVIMEAVAWKSGTGMSPLLFMPGCGIDLMTV